MLESGWSVDSIKFAGGWTAEKSLSHYLQEAEAALTLLNLSPTAVARLEFCLDHLQMLDTPPNMGPLQLLAAWTRMKQLPCSPLPR